MSDWMGFQEIEYWDLTGYFSVPTGSCIVYRMSHVEGYLCAESIA